jgi:SAM-dependent methyltransferase
VPAASIARRAARSAADRGPLPVLADCVSWAGRWILGRARAGRPARDTFRYDGADHAYLHHRYHYTWLNERAVEVPLAGAVLDRALAEGTDPARVLEVGNVLAHYRPVRHTVVDKYEQGPGVRNVDVADLDLPGRYDLVLAVSTLEHVGLDEDVLDPEKPARAIDRLVSALAPGGRLWCTVPVGYNPELDRRLREDGLGFTRLTALRRLDRANRWAQVPVEDVWGIGYDRLLYTAHAVVVAEYVRAAPASR